MQVPSVNIGKDFLVVAHVHNQIVAFVKCSVVLVETDPQNFILIYLENLVQLRQENGMPVLKIIADYEL